MHDHPLLRTALARRALERGVAAAPEEIVVTQGCTEAVNLALRAVTQPGDTVAVESPMFYGLLQIIEALGLRAIELPTSPRDGLSVEALAFALDSDPTIRAVMVMPTLHNPLGCTMSDARKEELVRLCEARGVPLIEDDIYGEMRDQPPRPLKDWDRGGNVIHCDSLNKVLAPGLRLGWMLAGRWQARVEMLKTRLTVPEGGMLLWLQLPEGASGDRLFAEVLGRGIKIAPGSMFSAGRRFDGCCGRAVDDEVRCALRELGGLL